MLKSVKLKDKVLAVPIIQGGMGVGVSLSGLAGSVMKQGGMGVISAAHPGYRKETFRKDSKRANCDAIFEEVKKARAIADEKGLLGINIMVASKDYETYIKAAVDAKVDAIISGAGLPVNLPEFVNDENILLAPIVSSGKAMKLILRMWDRRYHRIPDFVVVEGSEAGGHLGFKKEDLMENTCKSLEDIFKEVKQELVSFCEKYEKEVPVFVAGGIYTGDDIAKFIKLGASGVQMGTRFIATEECDANIKFKEAIVNCKKEDIAIVQSPTGFPGRGILNEFMVKTKERGNICVKSCLNCLTPCKPADTPYCISEALIQSVKGNLNRGLIFVGSNAYRIDKIVKVAKLMNELISVANKALED